MFEGIGAKEMSEQISNSTTGVSKKPRIGSRLRNGAGGSNPRDPIP